MEEAGVQYIAVRKKNRSDTEGKVLFRTTREEGNGRAIDMRACLCSGGICYVANRDMGGGDGTVSLVLFRISGDLGLDRSLQNELGELYRRRPQLVHDPLPLLRFPPVEVSEVQQPPS